MSFEYTGFAAIPGIDSVRETFESIVTWGPWEYNRAFVVPTIIDGELARDAGHESYETVLRTGLLLGMITATKKVTFYDPVTPATNGSEDLYGILLWDVNTQQQAANKDRWFGYALIGGNVKASALINTMDAADDDAGGWVGGANDAAIRAAMINRFILDDLGQV